MVKHFWAMAALSVLAIFCIAVLSRSELRLSGEVLGAGDGVDLARIFELNDCTRVTRVRGLQTVRLYHLDCTPYDYLVESIKEGEDWVVVSVEKIRD